MAAVALGTDSIEIPFPIIPGFGVLHLRISNAPQGQRNGRAYGLQPDTTSPMYPDRPIRPLPKRPLRSRLSQEAADSILYPPAPPSTSPLFYFPYDNGDAVNEAKVHVQQNMNSVHSNHQDEYERDRALYDDEGEGFDGDGRVMVRRPGDFQARGSFSPSPNTGTQTRQRTQSQSKNMSNHYSKLAVPSSDGYDAFENTNNKKKRKIPTSGSGHSATLSTDLPNMGNCLTRDEADWAAADDGAGVGQYYGSGNPATPTNSISNGMSGAGRGRFGRSAGRSVSGRSPLPLGVSTNASNAWMNGRGSRQDSVPGLEALKDEAINSPEPGIISTAIAQAAATPTVTPKGLENVSLLDQEASKKSSPKETQFTFTCESESAKSISFPAHSPASSFSYRPSNAPINNSPSNQSNRGVSTQGTQTSPNMADQPTSGNQAPTQAAPPVDASQANTQGKKSRRRPGAIYTLAARQRRLTQQYNNARHPPPPEDIWICEFCEYESIFGRPPKALIRQYEIKDRKEKRRLQEKRRLLEKAKAKGRKGKKATKNAVKAATQQAAAHQHAYDQQVAADKGGLTSHGTQSEEYLADDYDYDDEPIAAHPTAHDHHAHHHAHPAMPNATPANIQQAKVGQQGVGKGNGNKGGGCGKGV